MEWRKNTDEFHLDLVSQISVFTRTSSALLRQGLPERG